MKDSFTFSQVAKIATGVLLVAIVLLIVGTTASTDSLTSFIIAAGIIGLVATILLGRKIWWLLVLVPLVSVPLFYVSMVMQAGGASLIVLPFMGALAVLGRIKLKWNKYWPLDLLILALSAMYIQVFVRHPAGIHIIEVSGMEYIGGKEYVLFLFAVLSYLACSLVITNREELLSLARWCFVALLISLVINGVTGVMNLGQGTMAEDGSSMSEEMLITEGRYGKFLKFGQILLALLFCRYSWTELLTSFWRLPLLLVGLTGIIVSGFRTFLIEICSVAILAQMLRKKIWSSMILGMSAFAGLLLLSESGILKDHAPYGIQRAVSFLPLVEVRSDILHNAEHSVEWRQTMWKWAFDDRENFIKDRIWGDGFSIKAKDLEKDRLMRLRGSLSPKKHQENFARNGVWHSGPVECIHRLGYVGLAVVVLLILCMVFVFYRVSTAMMKQSKFWIFLCIFLSSISSALLWFYSAGSQKLIINLIPHIGFAKLVYVTALREGLIEPLWSRQQYVPLLMRENARALPQVSGHLDK